MPAPEARPPEKLTPPELGPAGEHPPFDPRFGADIGVTAIAGWTLGLWHSGYPDQAFEAANKFRPNFMAVAGYDGMHVIYNALAATKGAGGGDALLAAMKGQIFESPRGPILIDAQTRDIVQDVYIRKVEKQNGQLYNVEFDVQKAVKDPAKTK